MSSLVIFGSLMVVSGMMFIFISWKSNDNSKLSQRGLKWPGWLLILLSLFVWEKVHGIEFGTVYWSILVFFVAALSLGLNASISRPTTSLLEHKAHSLSLKRIGKSFSTFIIAGPLALIASCTVAILITRWLPMQPANSLVLAAFLFPILWSLTSFWVCATDKRMLPTTTIIISGFSSSLVLLFQ